jgi:hypothetical protein
MCVEEVEENLHTFLNSTLDEGESYALRWIYFRVKPPIPIRQKAVGAPELVLTCWKR